VISSAHLALASDHHFARPTRLSLIPIALVEFDPVVVASLVTCAVLMLGVSSTLVAQAYGRSGVCSPLGLNAHRRQHLAALVQLGQV